MAKLNFSNFVVLFITLISATLVFKCDARNEKHLRVVSYLEAPNMMPIDGRINSNKTKDYYEGFSKDLADLLAKKLNFTYDIHFSPHNHYGKMHPQYGTWNGLVSEIMNGTADVATAQMTITRDRSRVIDFSTPVMNFQLGIVIYSPNEEDEDARRKEKNEGIFIFLRPFNRFLWITFVISAILLLFLIFLVEKFVSGKIIGVKSSRTFCSGFCGKVFWPPSSIAARILQIIFWIYLLIFFSSYTANFAADRVVDSSRHESTLPINSYRDLLKQTGDFEVGIVRSGSTFQYLSNTKRQGYKDLYKLISKFKGRNFLADNEEGIKRVRNDQGKFAFIMEGPAARYAIKRRPCNLALVKEKFGPKKGFGIGTKWNSELSRQVNEAVMELKENGQIGQLEKRWFDDVSECPAPETDRDFDIVHVHSALTLKDMFWPFVFLLVCIFLSIGIAFLEIFLSTPRVKK